MKKLVSILLMLTLVFALASCNETTDDKKSAFDEFDKAAYSTLSSRIVVETTLATALGELEATVETVFNPDGSATVNYSVESFAEDFNSSEPVVKTEGSVDYKDGKYTGDLEGTLGTAIVGIDLKLDETKMEYTVKNGTLSGTVKAENVKAVFGVEIPADVSFMLTKGETKITSLTMQYTLPEGDVTVVCSYN